MNEPDSRLLRVLLETFWGASGYRDEIDIDPADFDECRDHGLMFDQLKLSHDQMASRIMHLRDTIDPVEVGDAFLVGITHGRPDLRSALGSAGCLLHFPDHERPQKDYKTKKLSDGTVLTRGCSICGSWKDPKDDLHDLNILSFQRHKWGGVRHYDALYAMFDLEQFLSTKLNRKSADGKARVLAFLNHADSVAENYSPTKLAADAAKIIDLKGDQLDAVMQILAYAGILVPREGPNYFIEWIRPADHPVGNPRSRWSYPFGHWKGADRVNWHSVEYWFPGIKTA